MGPKRRKLDAVSSPQPLDGILESNCCVIHFTENGYSPFTHLNNERFEKIQHIASVRLNQPVGSTERLAEVCSNIPSSFDESMGYHRKCYLRFTRHTDRLTSTQENSQTSVTKTRNKKNEKKETYTFRPDCIFCNKLAKKKVKKNGVWWKESLEYFSFDDSHKIVARAEDNKNEMLLLRIRGYDLVACKAKFHRSCRRAFLRNPFTWRSTNEEETAAQESLEEAHATAFARVAEKIQHDLIEEENVVLLADLREMYLEVLGKTKHQNQEYRGEKLKKKI